MTAGLARIRWGSPGTCGKPIEEEWKENSSKVMASLTTRPQFALSLSHCKARLAPCSANCGRIQPCRHLRGSDFAFAALRKVALPGDLNQGLQTV